MTQAFLFALATVAVVTGALTGLTGASGMSILITGLMLLDINIRDIIGLTFVVTLANSIASSIPYWRRGHVLPATARNMGVSAAAGVILGFVVGGYVPPALLQVVMLVAISLVAIKLIMERGAREDEQAAPGEAPPSSMFLEIGLGALCGVVMGIMGGGGGVFIALMLMVFLRCKPKDAVGTSIVIMAIAAASGLLLNAWRGTIPWMVALVVLPISTIAAFGAARVGREIPDRRVKQLLGAILIIMVLVLVVRKTQAYWP